MNTEAIDVSVKTQYLEQKSKPEQQHFVYSYTITIKNQSEQPVQLLGRHWIITDENDAVQEVQGIGVVGEQPQLQAGEEYTYTSGVALKTEIGTMHGSYQMVTNQGDNFDAAIPTFALVPPHALH